jgi:hypothetical protein
MYYQFLMTGADLHKPATAATGVRVKKAGVCVKLRFAGIYFSVHAIFVASKLWIWQKFNFFAGQLPAFIETVCLAK